LFVALFGGGEAGRNALVGVVGVGVRIEADHHDGPAAECVAPFRAIYMSLDLQSAASALAIPKL
jgi:hypothetical protein